MKHKTMAIVTTLIAALLTKKQQATIIKLQSKKSFTQYDSLHKC